MNVAYEKGSEMTRSKAFFYIETQWDNLGDALINRSLIRLMSQHADVTPGVSSVPDHFKDMIGRDFLSQYTLDATSGRAKFLLSVLREQMSGTQCYIFLSPGGWIGELDGRLNLRSWSHTAIYHILRLAGVRICQIGVSYEDIGRKLGLQLQARSPAMYRHYVRDDLSRTTMQARGVRIDGLCPDLAFNDFGSHERAGNADAVTFSFRGEQYPEQMDEIKSFIASFFELYGLSRPVYFVSQVKKDMVVNQSLTQWVRDTYTIETTVEDSSFSIEQAEQLYARSNIVVSNRLHVLLLAGSVGNAMIAAPIGDSNKKIRSLFNDIGLGDHVFRDAQDVQSNSQKLISAMSHLFDGNLQKTQINQCVSSLFKAS